MHDTILVPTAGDEGSGQAINYAVQEARLHDADIQLLTIKDDGTGQLAQAYGNDTDSSHDARAKQAIQEARQQVPEEISVDSFITDGVPTDEILSHVETYDIDLVVMATQGRTGIRRAVIGSTTESVVRHSDTPVLTVHADNAD